MTSLRVTGALLFSLAYLCLTTGSLVRKNVDSLTEQEIQRFQSVLHQLEEDKSDHGFQSLAAFHGEPSQCQKKDGSPVACCIHGEATFPLWHRAYVVQFEQALVEKGLANLGVPYWEWTRPITELPDLVRNQIFKDTSTGTGQTNAWFSAQIDHGDVHTHTARAVDDRLFEKVEDGKFTRLFSLVLDALEQTDYCHFEAQFEVAHNHIHYLVGGRHHYSMSTLEYSSYDPIFFLHHSNVDRLFVIWQELQKKRGLPHDHAHCSVELFNKPMEPFKRDSNPVEITRTYSKPKDLFSHMHLGYNYDTLELNGMSMNELYELLEERRGRDRHFAAFSLHGLGFSANVRVKVCDEQDDSGLDNDHEEHCELAGDFFILGGANEMPWEFTVPVYFDITDTLHALELQKGSHYGVRADVYSVNGTLMGSDILGMKPHVSHRPARDYKDPEIASSQSQSMVVRKDINTLTREEVYELRQAMSRFQNDTSIDGYQAIAEYHGVPAKCPHPDAAVRYACCIHGMPTFPHWHRLFTTEVEDELRSRGLHIGIPYWDWTEPNTHIPALAADETYEDPHTHQIVHNPFHDAPVAFLGQKTTRDVQAGLTESPKFGDHTSLFDGILLAFEQTDYCDFEVQFEVIHNSVHFLVGGYGPYTLATLHYSAFDPIFYLHHSNVDRLWAIWQKLQMKRGKLYKAHCAGSLGEEVMKPFGFPPPYHNDVKIHDHAKPSKVYNYEEDLDYTYDSLQFGGMTVDQLDHYLSERRTKDRTFVGIMLHHIGVSAWCTLSIERPNGELYEVGHLAVLGGEQEMPWHFDRLFKVEITDALHKLGYRYDDDFNVRLDITDVNGKKLPEDTFKHDTIIHEPASLHLEEEHQAEEHVRNDIETLTVEQQQDLREALHALMDDHTAAGFDQIASFHGQPNWCPSPDAEQKFACCTHGMPVFPHWHRLLTVQAENALIAHGMHSGLPYWDWALPMTSLPKFVSEANYVNPKTGKSEPNPWFQGTVNGHNTARNPRSDLFTQPEFGKLTPIAEQVMLAFEQDDFCSFEIQFEIAHNFIHALVGGNQMYSMASLRYTAFDPLFYLHHSNTDRIWAIWQVLQKYRGKPYNSANCAISQLRKPLQPFAQTSVINPDSNTRDHSVPFEVFDYQKNFHYHYDNLIFNGMSPAQIQREVVKRQGTERVFAGFMLHGIKTSALVTFQICKPDGTCKQAGEFYLLGDQYELPWSYDRLYKYEITNQLKAFGLEATDRYDIRYTVSDLEGKNMGDHVFDNATVVYSPGLGHEKGHEQDYLKEVAASSHLRRNLKSLTTGEAESLRSALNDMHKDGSFADIAKFHGYPGLCRHEGHPVACCVHGSPAFPHWHRLYVEQVENELLQHGSAVSMPYWEWTESFDELPKIVADSSYFDSRVHKKRDNPFFRSKIPDNEIHTARDPRFDLYDSEYFLDNVLLALEQTSYCDFEVQFEVVHNSMHSFIGGRAKYAMSNLDYTAFDPIFFLHHANVDRIWAIWQALQKFRGRPFDETDCALNIMGKPLHPFDDQSINHFGLTHLYSRPMDVWDYSNHLGYHYDNLEFHGWSISELEAVLEKQRSRDRMFAGFMLHNIGTSAVVEIDVCVDTGAGTKSCDHPAGKFSVLGGDLEMPFTFDRLYKFDITDTIRQLGIRLDSAADFELEIKIRSYNGSFIDSKLLGEPTIIFLPGKDNSQDEEGHTQRNVVRKNVRTISPAERRSLVLAMKSLQADSSAEGFQAIAAFHALPPLCPHPEATSRFACCVHGMGTFPQWHRLYTVQFDDALRRHGAITGIPYWDTVVPNTDLPAFFSDETWDDPLFHANFSNPWHGAHINFTNKDIARSVNMEKLAKQGPKGYDTWSWKQYIFALEQEDYCDFEVQFEIAHNAIHNWIGGNQEYSMSHLHFASYDPVFILHHSNTDRIFAIWQELQKLRGHDPNEVNCALEKMKEPLKPFSFGSPYNMNPTTKEYSKPEDTFDYKGHFHYEYDSLELQGMGADRLQDYINKQKEKDRTFAGFLLSGVKTSAHVHFSVCKDGGDCTDAGYFDVLGGSLEMPWMFDRLYKYEITDVLTAMGLDVHDNFHIEVDIKDTHSGAQLSSTLIPQPSVIYKPHLSKLGLHEVDTNRERHELSSLTERDEQSLMSAIIALQKDDSNDGYQNIAAFHGAPAKCPAPEAATHACCIHGMPTFPHWHRLYTVEIEDALIRHGSGVALPYWDWTKAFKELPKLFTAETFYNALRDEVVPNPFVRAYIKEVDGYTTRDPQPQLQKLSRDGKHSILFDEVLLALEQTDYCDFEVQFEVTHNAIHYLVGGRHKYSLSSLEYSSYDPMFFVHHAMMDKIWAVWQELQKRRGLTHDRADCAVNFMNQKMHPFDWEDLNPDVRTREHALPMTVFNYEDLDYHYDNFEIGGNTLEELEQLIHDRKRHARVFAAFHLHGIGTSADVEFSICKTKDKCTRAGGFFILGGPLEMPWSFDRLFKYDITEDLHELGIQPEDVFNTHQPFFITYAVHAVNGSLLPESSISAPTLIFKPAEGGAEETSFSVAGAGVRKDINTLTAAEMENLRTALKRARAETGQMSYDNIARAHGYPPQCQLDGREVACCHHGMASFPAWHRLFTRQMEIALTWKGAKVGIPYWEWTEAFTELPTLVADENDNPFHHGHVPGKDKDTSRAPRPQLFKDPEHGEESFFYRQALLAFEQRDFCDFEVQFEVLHNAIHSWTGGSSPYGMSTLEYSAYDPLFFIHHSNVDRQFTIWQALQEHRGLDSNTANCNIEELRRPLEPFNRDDNPIISIRAHSRAIDAFNQAQFGYQYDNLKFHGMTIAELDHELDERKKEDRVFLNFMLHGFNMSADVDFDLCDTKGNCNFAGTFAVLGGPLEMPWQFDRLFKYDVTKVFQQMRLRPDSNYTIPITIRAVNGMELDASILPAPSVSFVPGRKSGKRTVAVEEPVPSESNDLIRYELSALSVEQVTQFGNALYKLQNDFGPNGYEAIASFHGAPGLCPENATDRYSCCQHGMPVFPHWHRLLTVQFEQALKAHGATIGVPYWEWTRPAKQLPDVLTQTNGNPLQTYRISFNEQYVQRDVSAELFSHPSEGDPESLFHQALELLEETNFCDFELQYEMLHNVIHALVGGSQTYSMATLEYSAFDPFFMVHHSSIDRLWQIWQILQKLRQKPFNYAKCAFRSMFRPLPPFSYQSVNKMELTRANSQPVHIFDHNKFHYKYDSLKLKGHSVAELNEMIHEMQSQTRTFVGFVLRSIGTSARVHVDLVKDGQTMSVGNFFVLGGPTEMPWAYERIYKMDMTEAVKKLGVVNEFDLEFKLTATKYDGTPLQVSFPDPVIVRRRTNSDFDELIIPINKAGNPPHKMVVRRGTRVMFHSAGEGVTGPIRELGSFTNSQKCAIPPGKAHAYDLDVLHTLEPGNYYFTSNTVAECQAGTRIQISIDEE